MHIPESRGEVIVGCRSIARLIYALQYVYHRFFSRQILVFRKKKRTRYFFYTRTRTAFLEKRRIVSFSVRRSRPLRTRLENNEKGKKTGRTDGNIFRSENRYSFLIRFFLHSVVRRKEKNELI